MTGKKTTKGKIVLVVEDESALREALQKKFELKGFTVVTAIDGQDGLAVAERVRPHIILVDLLMPNLGGMEMIAILKKYDWGRAIPVIILTNVSEDKVVVTAIKNHVFDYLVKSNWDLEEVVKKVSKKLGLL